MEVLAELEKCIAPSVDFKEMEEAESYTRFLHRLHDSAKLALNFESHAGFGRDYPGSPMIDENFSLTDKEWGVLNALKERKPFRVSDEEYVNLIQECFVGLAAAHQHVAPLVRFGADYSCYTPHVVFLAKPRSLVTAFHEYIHSLGFGEVGAVWWSTNVFRLLYPKSFAKLKQTRVNPHLLRKTIEDESVLADEDFSRKRPLMEFKDFHEDQIEFLKELKKKRVEEAKALAAEAEKAAEEEEAEKDGE